MKWRRCGQGAPHLRARYPAVVLPKSKRCPKISPKDTVRHALPQIAVGFPAWRSSVWPPQGRLRPRSCCVSCTKRACGGCRGGGRAPLVFGVLPPPSTHCPPSAAPLGARGCSRQRGLYLASRARRSPSKRLTSTSSARIAAIKASRALSQSRSVEGSIAAQFKAGSNVVGLFAGQRDGVFDVACEARAYLGRGAVLSHNFLPPARLNPR